MWAAAPAEASRRPAEADPGSLKGLGTAKRAAKRQAKPKGEIDASQDEPREAEVARGMSLTYGLRSEDVVRLIKLAAP